MIGENGCPFTVEYNDYTNNLMSGGDLINDYAAIPEGRFDFNNKVLPFPSMEAYRP